MYRTFDPDQFRTGSPGRSSSTVVRLSPDSCHGGRVGPYADSATEGSSFDRPVGDGGHAGRPGDSLEPGLPHKRQYDSFSPLGVQPALTAARRAALVMLTPRQILPDFPAGKATFLNMI